MKVRQVIISMVFLTFIGGLGVLALATKPAKQYSQTYVDTIHNLTYVKDHRTGLCFAVYGPNQDKRRLSLACVPCEDVKALLVNEDLGSGQVRYEYP